jgi:DNA repair exonuclease SbcCD ATPase subunit
LRPNEYLRIGPKKHATADESGDNYSTFLARIDQAAESLSHRKDSLSACMKVTTELCKRNTIGLDLWTQRRASVEDLRSGGPSTRLEALDELEAVAQKMESMFHERTHRLDSKLQSMRARYAEIQRSLLELETSKMKLHSSRMLSKERDNLNRAVAQLTGSMAEGPSVISDAGLTEELKMARGAIILAEALLEVKGT